MHSADNDTKNGSLLLCSSIEVRRRLLALRAESDCCIELLGLSCLLLPLATPPFLYKVFN